MANSAGGGTAIVTGAASGIGYAIVDRLSREKYDVVAVDIQPRKYHKGVIALTLDVSVADDVEAMVESAVELTGRLDLVCNNAGVVSTADLLSCSLEEWERVQATNARGVFLGTQAAVRHFLQTGGGAIVNNASVSALIGLPGRAAYSASKGAIVSFTRQVAIEYAAQGIRCNCICPGTVYSEWIQSLIAAAPDPEEFQRSLLSGVPMGRMAAPSEIASVVHFLGSSEASFITGAALPVDGGMVIR